MYDGFARVVVGFDGSHDARCALEWGIEAALRRRATLLVLVATGDPLYGGFNPLIVPGTRWPGAWATRRSRCSPGPS
jgi:nucleotide-binding universal stress UspA family protein